MSRALGRYELLRPLARGGMGEVYLARRRAAGVEKWLVVKRMRPERAGDARFLDLFVREARLSMSLAHQNIVPVFDFGRIDDQVFLAMERVEGKDLGSSLARAGRGLPPLLAAFVAAECLQALDYAHRRRAPDGSELGIIHRDVTPRNVLLSWAGEVKLTDFGIAALATDTSSKTAGTPAYMAPEQARGEALDVRADVYAVGLVLREALTGTRARRGNERETILELAARGELDPWPSEPSAELRAIADRATHVDKAARYPDARTMLEELDRFIVAERAAHTGDAPARALAEWLAATWKDARDDEVIDAKIEAGALLSFLDDGPLDIIGSGTQRSAMATAAEEEDENENEAEDKNEADTPPAPAPAPVPASPAPRRRAWLATPVVAAGLAVAAYALWPERAPTVVPIDAAVATAIPADAASADAPAADAAVIVVAEISIDAGIERRPLPPRPRAVDAGTTEPEPPRVVPVPTRKVTINSKPWSHWSVDGGAQHSGLETIELTPGKHTIHFTGNPYFTADKTVVIDVPDRDGFTHVETLEPAPAQP